MDSLASRVRLALSVGEKNVKILGHLLCFWREWENFLLLECVTF